MSMREQQRRGQTSGGVAIQQVAVGAVLLLAWEVAGRLTDSHWIARPSLIAGILSRWLTGDLYMHVLVTLSEMAAGLVIGGTLGIFAGIVLGRSPVVAAILRPIIVALYSVPLIALAPLFIMFFGIGLLPKIVLIAIVVFFLLFFNTFTGVTAVDEELIKALQLMGSSRLEELSKVVAPGCMVWILSGIKTALPYSLVGAVTVEMLASQRGIGFLLSQAAGRLDIAAMYAALVVLMLLGVLISEAGASFDRWMLRWRTDAS